MASSWTAPSARGVSLEDPLAYLPCSSVLKYGKGDCIYSEAQPSTNLYLVVDGKVKVSRCAADGSQILIDIYQTDEFFGESVFVGSAGRSEQACALEPCKVMAWTRAEIEEIASRQPNLAIALVQVMVQRTAAFTQRIESLCAENIGQRIARCLLRLADRMGTPQNDGSLRMIPITHELLAQYVGTSREVITMHMNRLRREGYVRYSRRALVLYSHELDEHVCRSRVRSKAVLSAAPAGL